jgi:acyl-CoA thioesterase-2
MSANDIPPGLLLTRRGDRRVSVENMGDADVRDVVYGGQLLAQSLLFANQLYPDRLTRSVHTIFARPGRVSQPTELVAEQLHGGRVLASETITAVQGDRTCSRALIVVDAGDPDYIRHSTPAPEVGRPEDAPPGQDFLAYPGTDVRVVGGIDSWNPQAPVGPPELFVWLRWTKGEATGALAQALLAYATDGFLIGTAMRPHEGVGQDLAHREISTGVFTHTMSFHAPIVAHEWLLLAFESPYAGGGRSYGRGQIFDEQGQLVASLVQDNMIRSNPYTAALDHTSHM